MLVKAKNENEKTARKGMSVVDQLGRIPLGLRERPGPVTTGPVRSSSPNLGRAQRPPHDRAGGPALWAATEPERASVSSRREEGRAFAGLGRSAKHRPLARESPE